MSYVFIYVSHSDGVVDDVAYELKLAAKKIEIKSSVVAIVTGYGDDLNRVCSEVSSFCDEVWMFNSSELSYPNAEIIRQLMKDILPLDSVFILPHSTFGMDLAPGLSVFVDSPFISDVVDIQEVNDGLVRTVRQEFGGMVSTHVECKILNGGIFTIRPGAFFSDDIIKCDGIVIDKSDQIKKFSVRRNFIEIVEPEAGDVDITKSDILVSIGRGIEDEDNIEIAYELAEVLGGVVSCSRPIVDAKWMEKARQVGTSGKTVKPKVYIACGISGSFQHMGGIKGAPFIIAINKNKKAPIFQVADIGVEADILEFIPELKDSIEKL